MDTKINFVRRSIWSVCIAFSDGLTVYTELDGRVYRLVNEYEFERTYFIEDLPDLYPDIFTEAYIDKFGQTQIIADFSKLPKFDQTRQIPDHRMINPDWSMTERQ